MIKIKKDLSKYQQYKISVELKNKKGEIFKKLLPRQKVVTKKELNKKFKEFDVQLLDYFDSGDILIKLYNLAPILRRRWDEQEDKEKEVASANRGGDYLPPGDDDQPAGHRKPEHRPDVRPGRVRGGPDCGPQEEQDDQEDDDSPDGRPAVEGLDAGSI
jgi:hypothetical protein